MSAPNGPQAAFRVGHPRGGYDGTALEQQVTSMLLDHRGLLEMPVYAVMAESVASGAYWYTFDVSVATVQSWLALTAGTRARVGDRLRAVATLTHRDENFGTQDIAVTNADGDVVCSGVARSVRVGRTTEALRALDRAELGRELETLPDPPQVDTTVSAIDPSWDGRRILAAIGRGDITRGPLCELLAMTLSGGADPTADPVLTVEPQPWMANPLGAIQGGVIASIMGQSCSLAGQAHTGPGDRYMLADLSVFYFRSPVVDGRPLTLSTATERVGRRMATVSATMVDGGGAPYVRAVADIAYERSGSRADAF